MSIENPSLLYVEQSLTSTQKARARANIGAQAAEVGKGLSTNDFDNAALGTLQSLTQKVQGIESGAEVNVIDEITVNGTAVTPTGKTVALTIPTEITVDQTYNGSSTNPQSGIAVAQALSGTGQVPTVTSNDDGKVLKASYDSVTSQGSFRWDSAPSGVPSTTSSDEGKVLGVTNSTGTLGWVSQTPAAHDSTVTVKTGDSTPVTLGSFTTDQSSNSDITIPLAVPTGTGEKSGLMSAADKAKLDGIATGAQVNVKPNWNATAGAADEILNKPTLSTVATSGSYNDLTDKPTIPVAANDSTVTVDMAGTQSGTNRAVGSFTVDQSSNSTLSIPAAVSGTKDGSTYTTHAQPGVMSYSDKEKLDDIEAGAEVNKIDEITVNGTAVTPVNKSVEITIPKEIYQATYGVTTYAEIQAAFAAGCWMTCLNAERLATLAYVGKNFYEFNYHRSRQNDVDEIIVYKVMNDNTWSISSRSVVPVYDGTANGLVPASGASATTYLKGDGTWDTPTDTTYSVFSTSADGLVPASDGTGETGKFLKGDGTWDTPTDTTYSSGDGIDISAQDVISVKTDGTTIRANSDGELEVIGGGGGGEVNVIEGVKLDGAASVLTPDASKNVTIPNAVATGETGATNGLMSADDKKALGTAVQYVENPYDQSSPKNLIAQQMFVVESDQQIIDIVTQQSSLINGKGTLFFRITGV